MNDKVLTTLNTKIQIGDLVVYTRNANGFISVSKGIVTNVLDTRVTMLSINSAEYLYGKPSASVFKQRISKPSAYIRLLTPITKEQASKDADFIALFNSPQFKNLNI